MKIGFIGLGRMGERMVCNLLEKNHKIVGLNRSPSPTRRLMKKGMIGSFSVDELVKKLPKKKIIWLMIPAGKPVDGTIKELIPLLHRGDTIIDGGNSFFKDSQRRSTMLKKKDITFLDVGTSGGIEGARTGACMMIGGPKSSFKITEKLYKDMCVKNGYGYMGSSGAGHFVKMVHNGIEYGMVGAINEGIEAVKKYKKRFGTDLNEVVKVYAHGSIIESRLMSWLYQAYSSKGFMKNISCKVPKGETESEMRRLEKISTMNVLREARLMRIRSRTHQVCSSAIAAMRNLWGGHRTNKKK